MTHNQFLLKRHYSLNYLLTIVDLQLKLLFQVSLKANKMYKVLKANRRLDLAHKWQNFFRLHNFVYRLIVLTSYKHTVVAQHHITHKQIEWASTTSYVSRLSHANSVYRWYLKCICYMPHANIVRSSYIRTHYKGILTHI